MRPTYKSSSSKGGFSKGGFSKGGSSKEMDPSKKKMMGTGRKKACRFCSDAQIILDYKEPRLLGPFLSERGKIVPRRMTGNCAFHQKRVTEAVKRARILALIPFMAAQR